MALSSADDVSRRKIEDEIRSTTSSLTQLLTALGRSAGRPSEATGSNGDTPDRLGVRIVTLSGRNSGAVMRADGVGEATETNGVLVGDEKAMRAYTNSNYQAVNNAIMLGGSCTADDPGVHVVLSDFEDSREDREKK